MNQIKYKVIEILIDHVRIVKQSLIEMHIFYNAWIEGTDKKKLNEKKREISKLEEDGDKLKISVIKKFAEAESHGLGKLLELALKTDGILNYINEFTDRLIYIETNLPDNIHKKINKILKKSIKMGEVLTTAIKSLLDPPEKAFNASTQVHILEHEIDAQYREFENNLYDNKDLEISNILKIKTAVLKIEQMADHIENIADLIRIISYST